MTTATRSNAQISRCGKYRYLLARHWADGPTVTFVMLNPSRADASQDDPTIRKCIGFAKQWGYGNLRVLNLFAVRATSPIDLKRVSRPIGRRNDAVWETTLGDHHGIVVCAWGVHGQWMDQDQWARRWLAERPWIEPMCLGVTNGGQPRHPLYLPYSAKRISFEWAVSPRPHRLQ